jgi:hypothetical protein
LKEPNELQKSVLTELTRLSDRVVVMSERGAGFLQEIYRVPKEKLVLIDHGIPDVPFTDPSYYKDQFGVEGKKVILTFGLIAPGKGIEFMISALPEILKRHEDVAYIILGATHPGVRRTFGEDYRHSLQRKARELGVQEHVVFQNRFVELKELCAFLGCADLYVTPYLNVAQIVSGTLAYAMGSGKAVISTPYWYAEEMLADGRGRLVPFKDSGALAGEIIGLLDDKVERDRIRRRAYDRGRKMIWSEVAGRYLRVFQEAVESRARTPKPVARPRMTFPGRAELPEIRLEHLFVLTDDTGIFQHAKYNIPDPHHGYTTDDNARALIATLMTQSVGPEEPGLRILASRYLSFLYYAFDERMRRFRNFMNYEREWVDEELSEDAHGRALWALGCAVGIGNDEGHVALAATLFEKALPAADEFTYSRSMAFALVGIHAYLRRYSGASETRRIRADLAQRLLSRFKQNATEDWVWLEDQVTYASGRIPQALLLSGQWMQCGDMVQMGLECLDWLLKIQTAPAGHFAPVGSDGWYPRGGKMARFDQQPIEANAMLEACIEAHNVTREERWLDEARRCFEWFLGRNDLGIPLFDDARGGCRDAVQPDRLNQDQGAESTLAWLMSLLTMHVHEIRLVAPKSGEGTT